jgi:hypothetical protein
MVETRFVQTAINLSYLNLRNINVSIVVSVNFASRGTCIVSVDINGQGLARSVRATHLKPVFLILNNHPGTVGVLGSFGNLIVVVAFVGLNLCVI